ncbi:N-acetylglucosaminyl-phosphatidylinositol biosynthetic protein gpi1 isoform X3 [Telopea speciosissima]|uniref:N-acetylglucosaminyl-phosphatidylinositol biosynthetic protein gpi1 isoform X3 n=1 Tax=Telopea speciosissima TaxID=54955 RepID=UPI001CC779D6|nr:N-acetylglucosaminyl-phosphatidylinositol biosynthetic protein gpi1 isoform X3 [Telopea speciosissima]
MKMRRQCRIWWPKQLSSSDPDPAILFGWFVHSSRSSLDIVVAVAASPDEISVSFPQSGLQDKSTFTILGHSTANCCLNGPLRSFQIDAEDNTKPTDYGKVYTMENQDLCGEKFGNWHCECHKFDGILENCRQNSVRHGNWIQLSLDSHGLYCKNIRWIPKLHHIHWTGEIVSTADLHVIIYDPPTFGTHHFSLTSGGSLEEVKLPLERPEWVSELNQKQPLPDLDTVVSAINSAYATKILFERCMGHKISPYWLVSIVCHIGAMFVASFCTVFYIVLQFSDGLLSYGSDSLGYKILTRVFSHTCKNVHIRSCQLLYWSTFGHAGGFRSLASVEYAERASIHKHSMWSSIAVDILLGNLAGFMLLVHAEATCIWISNFACDIMNNSLRSGCVWLMGVPAGFKLNMELAGVLGMTSLNTIQIWSTLWFFLGFLLSYFIRGLAISGIILGATIPAALVIDAIVFVTLHILTLHWLISLLYSKQIQALAALWRLFRGRKWNPLRHRLDSYDYTVEQHIVGSLLFTPLLLLLPTTSVFYIFFSIMNTVICFTCILIEIAISILHATPYAKIFLWMVRPRRFPSGVWFKIISGKELGCRENLNECSSTSGKSQQRTTDQEDNKRSRVMISLLHSNILNLGQIILPHYRDVFRGISVSSAASTAHGLLIGKRIPSVLGTGLPSTMPWMFLDYREYWRLCHDYVISCITDDNSVEVT